MLKTLGLASAAGILVGVLSMGALAQTMSSTPATPPATPPMALTAPPAANTGSGSSSDINQTGKVSGTVTGPQAVAPETKSPQLGSGNEK
jgi:hypothetical protein